MHRLTATYDVELPNWVRVKRADDDQLRFSGPIGKFRVEVVLVRNGGASTKEFGEDHPTRPVTRIRVSVSRDEDSEPPAVSRNEKGGRDFSPRIVWFDGRIEGYRQASVTAANRVIRFFKYKLHTPHLREFRLHDREFQNPKWTNEEGQEVASGHFEGSLRVLPSPGPTLLGEKDFTANDDSQLQETLENELSINTYQEFLSDAQTSICDGKLPRAVLEVAIACEVAVKQAFFAKTTAAGSAFEYLEDKGRIRISVVELLHGAAKEAFGESFKDVERVAYDHIDFLFQCRNKIAHRGDAVYRDKAGTEQKVDRRILETWWASVDTLMKWIEKHRT